MKPRTDKRTINRFSIALSLIALMQLIIAASVFAVENHPDYPVLPLEEMRITAYTKAFAERFGLPGPDPGTEPEGGLEAIEFAI